MNAIVEDKLLASEGEPRSVVASGGENILALLSDLQVAGEDDPKIVILTPDREIKIVDRPGLPDFDLAEVGEILPSSLEVPVPFIFP